MTIQSDTDEALVDQARRGSEDAFDELVWRYQHRAYATAVAVLADFELAQDVAQEAFLCAYRDLRKLKDPSRFGAWVSGIARYTALAVRRERGKVRLVVEQYGNEQLLVQVQTPEGEVEGSERRQVVHRALERLNHKDREALSLHYLEGMSYAGIAKAIGVGQVAVKGRIQRARNRLRKELEMVEEHFSQAKLPKDFVARIRTLLDGSVQDWARRKTAIEVLGGMGAGAVEPLVRALEDQRKWVRYTAAYALCEIGDARALQPLLQLLNRGGLYDQREEDGWPDLEGVGRVLAIPGMREAVLERVRQYRQSDGYPFIRILSQASPDDDEVFECLAAIFRGEDEHMDTRCEALRLLCKMGPLERAQQLLREAADSGNAAFLDTAFDLVSRRSGRPPWGFDAQDMPLEICEKVLAQGPSWGMREMAADLIYQRGEEGRTRLAAIARSGELPERLAAALWLARQGEEEAIELVDREFLGGRRQGFDAWSSRGIGRNRMRGSASRANIWKLAKEYPERAGPLVEEMYMAGFPQHKKAALRILARQRGAAFLPELRQCLGSGRPRYGEVAREAFWEMLRLRQAAEPTALEMLESDDWLERKAAVCLLRRWGKLTEEQRRQAQGDEHVAVREAAKKAS